MPERGTQDAACTSGRRRRRPAHFEEYEEDVDDGTIPRAKRRRAWTVSAPAQDTERAAWQRATFACERADELAARSAADANARISKLSRCSSCGKVKFGRPDGQPPSTWATVKKANPPAYGTANPTLLPYMSADLSFWLVCDVCIGGKGFPDSKVLLVDEATQHRLARLPPMLLQSLSCVGHSVVVHERYNAVAEGKAAMQGLMTTPFVSDAIKPGDV